MAVVKSGTNGKLYINGVLFTSTSGFSPASGGAFTRLGVQTDGTSEFANVFLDELRIWNVERTEAEIQAMRNCQMNASLSSLTANYHFDNGIADGNNSSPAQITLSSQTGSPANDGTLSGFGLTGTNSNWMSFASIASGNSCSLFFADTDADGFGDPLNSIWAATTPTGFVTNAGDCNDSDALIFRRPPNVVMQLMMIVSLRWMIVWKFQKFSRIALLYFVRVSQFNFQAFCPEILPGVTDLLIRP
ncbi:MAG: hypothetical protein IPJ26_15635 [Bacteroidetes bacterium]|nr:hypothetical protein [Bacteroidota bacterium]